MSQSRKLFRLFKSVNEYQKILQLLKNKSANELLHYANILTRVGFLVYWLFDNLSVLARIKFLENIDKEATAYRAGFWWFIGLCFQLATAILTQIDIQKDHSQFKGQLKDADQAKKDQAKEKLDAIQVKQTDNYLLFAKTFGDMVTASQVISLPKNIAGFEFNDGQIGIGGMVSAGITCYQLFPKAK